MNITEQGQAWHNMSAPPRSQIQIAPNRKGGAVVRVAVPGVLQQELNWKQYIMDFCEVDTWDTLIEHANDALPRVPPLPPFFVMGANKLKANYQLDPLVTVALLARTAQNLCLLNAKPMYTFERLRQGRMLNDDRVIKHLTLFHIERDI